MSRGVQASSRLDAPRPLQDAGDLRTLVLEDDCLSVTHALQRMTVWAFQTGRAFPGLVVREEVANALNSGVVAHVLEGWSSQFAAWRKSDDHVVRLESLPPTPCAR